MKSLKFFVLFLLTPLLIKGQYLEDFSFPEKGYLENFVNDFNGVDWTMSPWPNSGTTVLLGRDIANYFKTTGDGVLEAIDLDVEVCWLSPSLDITGTASFTLDLSWVGYEAGSQADYINVEYTTNGGTSWTQIPNAVGGGTRTIEYSGASGPTTVTSTTVGASSITGPTLQIRVCVDNSSLTEITTLDNVSATNADVPGNGPTCDLVLNNVSTTNENCPGANDGTLTVTATTTNGPLTYSISGPVNRTNATGVFTNLPDGAYNVSVNDNSFPLGQCPASGSGTVLAGVDNTAPTASNPAPTTVECDSDIPAIDPSIVLDENDDCVVPCTTEPWINEFHYDNDGTDAGEFIEIAGPADLNLNIYEIYTYDGFNGQVDQIFALGGIIDNEQNGFGALSFNASGLQNQLEGLALVKNGTTVIEFLSYEGTIVAQNGPAQGLTSTDVGVEEPANQANNESLSRIGTGNTGSEFTFADQVATAGALNSNQAIVACPENFPVVAYVSETDNGAIGNAASPRVIVRTYSVTDASGNSTTVTHTINVIDDEDPVAVCQDVTVELNASTGTATSNPFATGALVSRTDNCGISGGISATGPSTLSCNHVGSYNQNIFVFDINGNSGTCTAQITVQSTNYSCNEPPVANCQNITVNADANCEGTAVAGDFNDGSSDPDSDPLTFSVSPVGPYALGITPVVLTVSDGQLTSTCNATITVVDATAPLAPTPPAALNVQCASDVPAPIDLTATDNCDGAITVSPTAQVTPGSCVNDIVMVRTWTFSDAAGNTSAVSQTITVLDDTAPVAPAPPADLNLQCASDVPAPVDLTATDNCDGTITVSPTVQVTVGACVNDFTVVRTWTFSDACGNTSSVSQTITVLDDTAPVAPAPPADLNLQCSSDVPAPVDLTATDNCDGTITVSPTAQVTVGACINNFVIVRTWTFTDACGNTSSVNQTITVLDDTAPVAPAPPADLNLQCASDVPAPVDLTATDNCDGAITVSPTVQVTVGACVNDFVMVRTWTFSDACGNTSSVSQTITVLDDTAPVAPTPPADLNLQCASDVPAPVDLTATDDCDGTITVSPTVQVTVGACVNDFTVVRTWTFSDACGNTSAVSQTITVLDDTAPVAPAPPADLNLQCASDVPASTALTATDNCDGAITVSPTVQTFPGTSVNDFVEVRTWTFTDQCGNTSSVSQTITVLDNTAPTVVCKDPVVSFNGESTLSIVPSDVFDDIASFDNCSGPVTYNDMSQSDFSCNDVGSIISVTVTAYDITGNVGSCTAYVTVDGLPCGLTNLEDGIGCPDGSSATYDAGTGAFTLTSDICSPGSIFQDEAAYVKYDFCGNGEIVVQVTDVSGNGWAGITMRESDAPGAKKVALYSNLTNFIRREFRFMDNSPANPHNIYRPNSPWLRIKRQGNKFIGHVSSNGSNWKKVFNFNIQMAPCIQMGLVVISNTPGDVVTGTFNPVWITGGGVLPLSIPQNDEQPAVASDLPQDFNVFPNPATEELNVDLSDYYGQQAQVAILNQLGQPIEQRQLDEVGSSPERFDLNALSSGTYFIRITTDQGDKVKRFLIVK